MEALQAGKHVIVEKPIALSLHEARELVTFAQARELLAVGIAQARYELQIGEVVRLAHAGELGQPIIAEALIRWHRDDLYYASSPWRGTWEGSGGVLANQGYHMLDLMCWAFGTADVVQAIQESLTHQIEAADTAVAAIKFKAGGLGVISASTSAYPGMPEALNLFFDRGFVRFEGGKIVEWSFAGLEEPAGGRTLGSGASDPLAIGSSGHGNQWADIIQALQRGIDPRFTAVDTLPAIALLEAAREVVAP